jgi:hypothetical protein
MKLNLSYPPSKLSWSKVGYVVLVSLPVVLYIFKFSIVNRNGIFRGEDWDYFSQSYEAARISILRFHQFPWWNPWANGGQPLFANPQFGLFSLQMPLVLLFGTVAGLHISILLYFILGFWGLYLLLLRLGAKSKLISVLLSYIWVFSGFTSWHLSGGHYTFAVYLLAPWAFLTILNIRKKYGWLWFGLVASLLILTAAHYLTVETLAICGFIALLQLIKGYKSINDRKIKDILLLLKPYIFAGIVIIALSGFRIIYTLQFTHEYPRLESLDPPESWKLFIASLSFRHPIDPATLTPLGVTHYGWIEYADYFGLLTIGLFFYLLVRRFENKLKSISLNEWLLLSATSLSGLILFGGFSNISPFAIMHHLPVFNQMRVPSRFICWFVLGIILYLGRLPKKPVVYLILIISVIDVFLAGYPTINYPQAPYRQAVSTSAPFQQYEFYQTTPELGQTEIINLQNLRLMRATQQNIGEVYGYEPILNVAEYYYLPGTNLCGINKGCEFIMTKNAAVASWSPGNIVLKRTGDGPIRLNMNPGKVWKVNGKSPFATYKILELKKDFIINDTADKITVSYHPVL